TPRPRRARRPSCPRSGRSGAPPSGTRRDRARAAGGAWLRSETDVRPEVEAPREQAVVLGVSELALRDRVAPVREVAPGGPHLPAALAVADARAERRVGLGEGGVPLVEVAVAHVAQLQRAHDPLVPRPRSA